MVSSFTTAAIYIMYTGAECDDPYVSLIEMLPSVYRHLARNPFRCDCELMWLADYLHDNPVETSGAKCVSPSHMEKRRLVHMRQNKARCWGHSPNPLIATCEMEALCPSDCTCTGMGGTNELYLP